MEEQNSDYFSDESIEGVSDIEEQYLISQKKFIILSVATLGVYCTWWTYKAWRFFQQKEKTDIMPALRALTNVFFLISLLNKIRSYANEKGYGTTYSSVLLYVGFLLVSLLVQLPDPYWLLAIGSFVFLIAPFEALNFAKRNSPDLAVIEQDSFNRRQKVLVILGGIFWFLVIFGLIGMVLYPD